MKTLQFYYRIIEANQFDSGVFYSAIEEYTTQESEKARREERERYDELFSILIEMIATEKKKYKDGCHAACVHNNTDGVGIHFDYMPMPALPKWVDKIEEALAAAGYEGKEGEQ